MFSPTKSSIKEANDHLQALYKRVSDLESTVKEQAESLIKRDEESQRSVQEIARNKDREITELRKSLEASEAHVQGLLSSCREKDTVISHLQYKCKLLEDATLSIPALDQLMRVLTEAHRFSTSSGTPVGNCTASSPPGGPPVIDGIHQQHLSNSSRNFSISEGEGDEEVRFRQDSTHSTV